MEYEDGSVDGTYYMTLRKSGSTTRTNETGRAACILPVITLKSEVKINGGDGSYGEPWEITI